MKKSILILGLISVLLLGSISFATENNVKIETETIKQEVEKGKISIEIPIVKGLKNLEYEKKLNSIIKTSVEKDLEEFKKDVEELVELDVEWESQMLVGYKVKSKSDVLSIIVDNYIFTGGAHGKSRKDYYNIDLNKNKLIELEDLFVEDSDYKTIINDEINSEIGKQILEEAKSYFEDDEEFITIEADHDFYIDENGNLIITFQPYEITPWYMGHPEFKIAEEKIVHILKSREIKLEKPIYKSKNNVMMIPLREVAEALDFKVTWDQENRIAKIVKEKLSGEVYTSPKGENKYRINKDDSKEESFITLEEGAYLENGTTFVPISFMRELISNRIFINENGILSIKY